MARLLSLLAAFTLAVPAVAAAAPDANFYVAPESPRAGDPVGFTSTSCDPGGGRVTHAWDLDGDGLYDDADGERATWTYREESVVNVGLQVTDSEGTIDLRRRDVTISSVYSLPVPDSARLMSPFPVVRLAGETTRRGARIDLLAVRGPVCARVAVKCRGRSCGKRGATDFIGRGRLRVRAFERSFKAGTTLEVRVSKGNLIGKLTRFSLRRDRPPKRTDLCLKPGDARGSTCPQD